MEYFVHKILLDENVKIVERRFDILSHRVRCRIGDSVLWSECECGNNVKIGSG